jgi:hypothetical protein
MTRTTGKTLFARSIAAAVLVVAAVLGTTQSAAAMTNVPCGSRTDFLKIRIDNGAGKFYDNCMANAGSQTWGGYVSDAWSGNNEVTLELRDMRTWAVRYEYLPRGAHWTPPAAYWYVYTTTIW